MKPDDKRLKNLKSFQKGLPGEQKAIHEKAVKNAARNRTKYASMREAFMKCLDDDKKEEAFDILWEMFTKRKNLKAFDRITYVLGETAAPADADTNTGGVIVIPERNEE